MKVLRSTAWLVGALWGWSASAALADACSGADLLLTNAVVHTVDASNTIASSVAVKGDRIVFVGDAAKAKCSAARTLDLKGAAVYPGFADAHIHLLGVGYRERALDLRDARSLEHFLQLVKARVEATPPGEWVEGLGWIEKYWPERRFATRHDLDRVAPNHPLLLERSDGHTSLANSYALKLAGIDAKTKAPPDGIIQRDERGEPNGILVDGAIAMVAKLLPPKTEAQDKQALQLAIDRNVRLGWTQIQNAGGNEREIKLLGELAAEGNLKHRAYYAPDDMDTIQRLLKEGRRLDAQRLLTVRSIKLFADGALGSRGAAMLEPYADEKSTGLMLISKQQAMPILEQALRKGIQVETHAIGDRANRLVLDWYEEAFRKVAVGQRAVSDPRWRIEHLQVIAPEDQDRLKQLQVIPSMQPSHAIGDMYFAPTRLGPVRSKHAYVWQSLIDRGVIIAGGSDAPVEVGDPRIEFYAAIVRKDTNGHSTPDWHVEEAVSRQVALKMFTAWAAYAAFEEDIRGSVEPGKLADFTVFDRDLLEVPPNDILDAKVLMTIVGGRVVYSAT